jgi:hypothetical protein
MTTDPKHELEVTLAAREELGPGQDDQLIAGFLERIDREIDRRVDERVAKRVRGPRDVSLALPMLGISIPLLAIAAVFAGLAGVIVVCAAVVLLYVLASRER